MQVHLMQRAAFAVAVSVVLSSLVAGCALFSSAQDRLLSIDYYHIKFKPPPGLTADQQNLLKDSWRAQIIGIADAVELTVADNNVYGDRSLWDPILRPASTTGLIWEIEKCRAKNTDSKSLKVLADQNDTLLQAQVIANVGDLTHGEIPNAGPCDIVSSRRLLTLTIDVAPISEGIPVSNFQTFQISVDSSTNIWQAPNLSELTATYDPGPVKGTAQFIGLFVPAGQWGEAIIIPRGSYFGDAKIIGQ